MILKGNRRGGGQQLAVHLLNDKDNDHVQVHEVSGFIAQDIQGAFNEVYAVSQGTKATKYLYSLSLSPPKGEHVTVADFEKAIERIEKQLKLEEQPRVIVFHEKEGRRHAHCVWSRIGAEQMKAIEINYDHMTLRDISKAIYLENDWCLPDGLQERNRKNKLNYSFAEYQEAKRLGLDIKNIKRDLLECWGVSDNRQSFEYALEESGYYLARGRKHHIVIDLDGNTFSLKRKLGKNLKDIENKLGSYEALPSAEHVNAKIAQQKQSVLTKYLDRLKTDHEKQHTPLLAVKDSLVKQQRDEREQLNSKQEKRWQEEEQGRYARINHGVKGLWDKLSGHYWKNRKHNEREAWQSYQREQKARDALTVSHLEQREALQTRFQKLEQQQAQERASLTRDVMHNKAAAQENSKTPDVQKNTSNSIDNQYDNNMEI